MKALFVSYNQAYHEEVLDIMQRSGLKGYTFWDTTMGSGSFKGEPHLGSHAWPTLNSSLLIMAEDSLVPGFKRRIMALDEKSPAMGLRCFSWSIDQD